MIKQNGHEVHLIFDPRLFGTDEISNSLLQRIFDIRKHNVRLIKKLKPDLVGFSVYTQDYQWSLNMAKMIKQEIDVPIIFGGIHPTLCPEQVAREECIDYVCVGEGENLIYQLNEGLPKNRISGPYKLVENLDTLPFIDRDIFYEQRPLFKQGYTISTGRGCPYQCTFCASVALGEFYRKNNLGKYVRQRSVDNVISELMGAKRRYKPSTVYFTDDVFTLSTVWLRDFAKKYKQSVNLPFYCTANPGTIKEEEIHLLKESGCQMIGFGMQSCNEETRKNLLKRTGSNGRIANIAILCKQLGIHFSFDHIFNLPTEPIENQIEALRFYNETKPDTINTFDMTYLPKIELNKFLDEETKKEVENGNVRTSMFKRNLDCFPTMCAIIPIFSRSIINRCLENGLFRKFRLPFIIRLLLKDIKRLQIGRYSDIFFPLQLLLVNVVSNLRIKWRNYQL